MKTITTADIMACYPCFNPETDVEKKCLPHGWSGTILDILTNDKASAKDRVWITLRLLWKQEDITSIKKFSKCTANRAMRKYPNSCWAQRSKQYAACADDDADDDADADDAYAAAAYAYAYACAAAAAAAAAERLEQVKCLYQLLKDG